MRKNKSTLGVVRDLLNRDIPCASAFFFHERVGDRPAGLVGHYPSDANAILERQDGISCSQGVCFDFFAPFGPELPSHPTARKDAATPVIPDDIQREGSEVRWKIGVPPGARLVRPHGVAIITSQLRVLTSPGIPRVIAVGRRPGAPR